MRRHFSSFLLIILAATPAAAFSQSVIEGRVTLPQRHAAPVMNKRYQIVAEGGILSTAPPLAVVYLEGSFSKTPPASNVQMAQKDLAFVPTLLPVQVGTRVDFPNYDDTFHSIFSFSPAKRFDLGRYRADERPVPSQLFDAPGLVVLRCDIHEHMRGLILVVDTPYFVITDTGGRYRLTGLPAGHHTLKVWLDSRTTLERAIDLQGKETLRADFP
jgi:plastocyanin